ncbi:TraR/DksA family transcriptional regulator [Dissulfurirhabdus thermomarina]|uniref:TraR/DksA family transcriptional regulator n=1 Tax=Dissulfurirhabdus thermomarina TaxID=1765737 RepID=A0A6N9TRQ4_DISTH|nr:TraR/DksA C4-type zinc finger protein [Dissulfurirhabdus thermomarina]NDY41256.1 TraR/DksA family transcriptional regulator [Dissulfurirhabdus thermomarina]
MADPADLAQREVEAHLAASMALHRAATAGGGAVSALECVDCGRPIPEARRRAVPGCQRCRECQEECER